MSRDRAAVMDRPRSVSARQAPTPGTPRRPWRAALKLGVLGIGLAMLLGGLSFVLLFVADYNMAGNGSTDPRARAAWAWEYGDHLHYGIHLVAGRVLDLCPCSRNAAGAQYYYAKFHAITPRQKAVLANSKPSSPAEWAGYVGGPFVVWLDWTGDGIAWLGGQRPADARARQARSATAWRPTRFASRAERRSSGATSTSSAKRTPSPPARASAAASTPTGCCPGEQFQFTFTERGRFVYFCREHGEADSSMPIGMAGTIIVE